MGKALVIKNVDFGTNKLDTVELIENVECEGLSLSAATGTISKIGNTFTITAIPSPINTTDEVAWVSSDLNVATVVGGVVTAVGCGSVDITAVCGTYSAVCTITVKHVATFTRELNKYFGRSVAGKFLQMGALDNYCIGYSTSGRLQAGGNGFSGIYPVPIPKGATKMEITNADGFKPYGWWHSQTIPSPDYDWIALCYEPDDYANQLSDAGDRTVTIPTGLDYEGVDSVSFVFRYVGSSTLTQALLDAIVVTFTAE